MDQQREQTTAHPLLDSKPESYGVNSAEAVVIWNMMLPPLLDAMPGLQRIDLFTFGHYCTNRAYAEKMAREIEADGQTIATRRGLRAHPLQSAYRQALAAQDRAADKLGMTPAARRKLVDGDKPTDDGFDNF